MSILLATATDSYYNNAKAWSEIQIEGTTNLVNVNASDSILC